MDGNKDAALKCLKIGKEALDSGDKARAFKFLTKARRLDPSLPIDDLLSTLDESCDQPPPDSANSSSTSPSTSSNSNHAPQTSKVSSQSYTEEQVTIVRQIKSKKDYYQILGLEKGCSVEDVRKAYRKLSLKVHPDKNKAPGAEEAFKSVSKAFQCLSDEERKKNYDLMGGEESIYERPRAQNYNNFYEADIDADEIFRNFFFGMNQAATPFGPFRFRAGMGPGFHHHHTETNGSSGFNLRTLVQILPVILLLLLNYFPSSEPPYSLNRTYGFEHKKITERGVPYFVKAENFDQVYPEGSVERATLEERVQREYFSILGANCRTELQRQQWGLSYQTPHCDLLQQFEVAR
ncbi:hypothetical protein AMTRI_Chr05g71970 [Amborella trichopoda]|uniref:J domain-containing protein n=1 Tax=Amborella trichopoda TaxID=13333 RepID=W1NYJ4_AMBTC|nr:chaperone protein dnaJ 49 [Amborella trichopoda]ERN00376.1 hypothetical protein AMTR_s00104p00120250 [Amborella trichopoda]|eukprot:XP_006837807.1 chaperone protein dnaJ 49 [Amborella trichopoda]